MARVGGRRLVGGTRQPHVLPTHAPATHTTVLPRTSVERVALPCTHLSMEKGSITTVGASSLKGDDCRSLFFACEQNTAALGHAVHYPAWGPS